MKHYQVTMQSEEVYGMPGRVIDVTFRVWADSPEEAEASAYHYIHNGTIVQVDTTEVAELAQ